MYNVKPDLIIGNILKLHRGFLQVSMIIRMNIKKLSLQVKARSDIESKKYNNKIQKTKRYHKTKLYKIFSGSRVEFGSITHNFISLFCTYLYNADKTSRKVFTNINFI